MSDKIKKLSQAMRLGCKIRQRQCFGRTVEGLDAACALGAAMICFTEEQLINVSFCKRFPELELAIYNQGNRVDVRTEIIYRNDDLKQSREEIAGWLESIGH